MASIFFKSRAGHLISLSCRYSENCICVLFLPLWCCVIAYSTVLECALMFKMYRECHRVRSSMSRCRGPSGGSRGRGACLLGLLGWTASGRSCSVCGQRGGWSPAHPGNKVWLKMRHRGLACSLSAQMLTYHAKRTKIHHSALGCFMPYTLVWIKKSCSFEDECVIEIVQIIYRYKTVYLYKYTVQSLSELLKTRHFNFSFISLYNGSLNCFNMFQTILT